MKVFGVGSSGHRPRSEATGCGWLRQRCLCGIPLATCDTHLSAVLTDLSARTEKSDKTGVSVPGIQGRQRLLQYIKIRVEIIMPKLITSLGIFIEQGDEFLLF